MPVKEGHSEFLVGARGKRKSCGPRSLRSLWAYELSLRSTPIPQTPHQNSNRKSVEILVGARGIEPPASRSQTERSTDELRPDTKVTLKECR